MTGIRLVPLERDDREQFILDNQEAFNYGALEEFGMRDDHLEEDGQMISRETIEKTIDSGIAYRIMDGVLSGAVEPLAGLLTILAAAVIVPAMPYLLSFAAGAMIYVVVEELIPEMAEGEHSHIGVLFFAAGFTVMMALDVALG
jgi:ZIP family zinc transporter